MGVFSFLYFSSFSSSSIFVNCVKCIVKRLHFQHTSFRSPVTSSLSHEADHFFHLYDLDTEPSQSWKKQGNGKIIIETKRTQRDTFSTITADKQSEQREQRKQSKYVLRKGSKKVTEEQLKKIKELNSSF